jgi:small ligand-binding sensory domain FIST
MIVASALVTGNEAMPQLAEAAVAQAMAKAGCERAQEVLLFLTPDFARQAAASVAAASRSAQCLQVFGGIAAGVANEETWVIDRPAAVALVLSEFAASPVEGPRLSWCGGLRLPASWQNDAARYGLLYADSLSSKDTPVWQGARLQASHHAGIVLAGLKAEFAVSTGAALLSEYVAIAETHGHDLKRLRPVGEPHDQLSCTAAAALHATLPAWLREQRKLPLHFVSAAIRGSQASQSGASDVPHLVPILSVNADGSLTLAERLAPGDHVAWALRLPDTAEHDMRERLEDLAQRCPAPAFGAFFSCIGRGPFFYSGQDRDWLAFQRRFPGLPFIGAYGSGQLFPSPDPDAITNRLMQNSVVSVLFSSEESL